MTEARRLDVSALRAKSAILTIDDREYTIRGQLPVEMVAELASINEDILAEDDGSKIMLLVRDAGRLVQRLIEEMNDDVPQFNFELGEVLGIMAFLIGATVDQTFLDKVAGDLMDGTPLPDPEVEALKRQTEREARERGEPVEEDAPLPSASSSPSSSTASDESTVGDPNGGTESPGERSGSTALLPTDQ